MSRLLFGIAAGLALLAANRAGADETLVRYLFLQRFPAAQVESVARAPVAGLYEVYADGRLWYVDESVNYVFQGTLADARTRRNLTEERLRRLAAVPVDSLPLDLAIRVVRGNGSRRIAVFEDPDCQACRLLERELARINDVTLYVFLLPLEPLHPGTTVDASRIWCAGNQAEAWAWVVLQGGRPEGREDCITPFGQIAELARKYRITGAPTLILADGSRIAGAIPAERIEQALDLVQRRSSQARTE